MYKKKRDAKETQNNIARDSNNHLLLIRFTLIFVFVGRAWILFSLATAYSGFLCLLVSDDVGL